MSVADHCGLGDPESPLLARARAGWLRWCERDPALTVVADLLDLRAWTRRAEADAKDQVLATLAGLARHDHDAALALVWLLIPGAASLASRLQDLSPDIDQLIAGQLWVEVTKSHQLPGRGMAQAILNGTRREVMAELGVGHLARARDRVWTDVTLLDRIDERAALVETAPPDAVEELTELPDGALRDRAIGCFELWLLLELTDEATARAAPLRRGRAGLTSPTVAEAVANKRPEAARTLRRRAGDALDQLIAYAAVRLDDRRVDQWRADHPWRPLTWQEQAAEDDVEIA